MVLAFNLPYSGLKLMATLTDIILYQNPVDATNKMIRYKSDGRLSFKTILVCLCFLIFLTITTPTTGPILLTKATVFQKERKQKLLALGR